MHVLRCSIGPLVIITLPLMLSTPVHVVPNTHQTLLLFVNLQLIDSSRRALDDAPSLAVDAMKVGAV